MSGFTRGMGLGFGLGGKRPGPKTAGGAPAAPVNSRAPATTGSTARGSTLTCDGGLWSGSPSLAYQWQRGGVNIAGATASTYVTQVADDGANITCNVTATNGGGTVGPVASNAIGPVVAPPTLQTLTLSASSVAENAADQAVIGNLLSTTAGSTLTLFDNAGGRFVLSGNQLRHNGTGNLDYETNTFHSITVTETLAGAVGSPKNTPLTVNVTNVAEITLAPLGGTFSLAESAGAGDVAGAITGKTAGSTLSLTNDAGGRVALVGSNVVRGATVLDYETATSHSFTVRETYAAEAINSPRDTVLTLLVTDVAEGTLTAPVLTFEGTTGTNPMHWQSVYAGGQMWDGTNGDQIDMRWRVNGGAWNNDTRMPLDSDALLNGYIIWPLFNGTGFAAGVLVEVQERVARYLGGIENALSAWSNIVSDTMGAGAPPAPAVTFSSAAGDLNNEVGLDATKLIATKGVTDEGGSTLGGVRGTVAGVAKGYFELKPVHGGASGQIGIGIVGPTGTTSLTSNFGIPGISIVPGACMVVTKGGTSATVYANVDGNGYSYGTVLAAGDRLGCDYDTTVSGSTITAVRFWIVRADGSKTQMGPTINLTGGNRPATTYLYGGGRYPGDQWTLYGDSDNAAFLASALPTGASSYA